ncbi:MAG: hypothetical protein K2X47_01870 [Bdellovibrionales bacterium]|nr:hypothetical protein [Bdellovibrionales bacterium]
MKKCFAACVLFLSLNFSASVFASDDLRSLPSGTIVKSSVDYAILANSLCLVLTDAKYDYGFNSYECLGLFHQEKDATCMVEYQRSVYERKLSGFSIERPLTPASLLDGIYRRTADESGITVFYATTLSGKSTLYVACRSAGGKKSLSFDDLKRVLSPYFSIQMPAPIDF